MNYFFDPNFPLVYQQPYLEKPIEFPQENTQQSVNQKYMRILEFENQLLKKKVQVIEEKLKRYEDYEKESLEATEKEEKCQKKVVYLRCEYPNCKKVYKSSLALNLHIKLKHNGGTLRERQAYAKLILECQRQNKPIPEIGINFPPNYLENYRKRAAKPLTALKDKID